MLNMRCLEKWRRGMVSLCLVAMLDVGAVGAAPPAVAFRYAVTTSWLECCLNDIAGRDVPVTRVCPPGTCPGHFDMSPGIFGELQRCRVLFLFDFQKSIAGKLGGVSGSELELVPIHAPEGLCVPARYLEGCGAVRDTLARIQPERRGLLDAALERTRTRLADLEREAQGRVAKMGLDGVAVVASKRQAEFCQWLGMRVVAAYSGSDVASPAALQALVADAKKAHATYVIANLQEGRQFGEAIAEQINAGVIVFSNFPNMSPGQNTFDALVGDNLGQLQAAVSK